MGRKSGKRRSAQARPSAAPQAEPSARTKATPTTPSLLERLHAIRAGWANLTREERERWQALIDIQREQAAEPDIRA